MARLPPPQVIDFGLGLRRALLRAADALLPANAVMWQRTMALGRAQVVAVVADLGVADALAGGKATAAQLARAARGRRGRPAPPAARGGRRRASCAWIAGVASA